MNPNLVLDIVHKIREHSKIQFSSELFCCSTSQLFCRKFHWWTCRIFFIVHNIDRFRFSTITSLMFDSETLSDTLESSQFIFRNFFLEFVPMSSMKFNPKLKMLSIFFFYWLSATQSLANINTSYDRWKIRWRRHISRLTSQSFIFSRLNAITKSGY